MPPTHTTQATKTMQCVVKTAAGTGHLELAKREVPTCGQRDVLVKVLATAVCGTDVHIDEWNAWAEKRVEVPGIIGHEFVGEVIEIGSDVLGVQVGDYVSAETHVVCNTCEMCKKNYRHVCYNTKILGVNLPGSFAEYIAIPAENAFVCDKSLPVEVLSIMEPLGVAVHTAMEFELAGKDVAVVGCGPIGIMSIAVAKKLGAARVFALEPTPSRAEMAKRMGADVVINPISQDPVETILSQMNRHGVDVVLEFSGNIPGVKAALQYLKAEGKLAAAGLPAKPIDFDFAEFVYSAKTIKGIAGRKMFETWEQTAGLLKAGLDVSAVVTHVLPLSEYAEGLRLMKTGECCKAVLKP